MESVITNGSYGKIRCVEVESLNREMRHSIDLYRLVVIYMFIIADMQYQFCVQNWIKGEKENEMRKCGSEIKQLIIQLYGSACS